MKIYNLIQLGNPTLSFKVGERFVADRTLVRIEKSRKCVRWGENDKELEFVAVYFGYCQRNSILFEVEANSHLCAYYTLED